MLINFTKGALIEYGLTLPPLAMICLRYEGDGA